MEKYIDKRRDYGKYRTLSILPEESKIEYEKLMQPDPIRGADVRVDLTISSQESASRVEKEPSVPNSENTIPIYVTFMEAAKGTVKEIILPQKTICNKCNGTGLKEKKFCLACKGRGTVDEPKVISINIPAGIAEGKILRIKKNMLFDFEGFEDIFGGIFGTADKSKQKNKIKQDWYVEIHIDKHPKFERKGYDIYSTEYLPFYIGAGRRVKIDTLDGQLYYIIKKGTKDGDQICLKNRGIENSNNSSVRGNHYVTWKKK